MSAMLEGALETNHMFLVFGIGLPDLVQDLRFLQASLVPMSVMVNIGKRWDYQTTSDVDTYMDS